MRWMLLGACLLVAACTNFSPDPTWFADHWQRYIAEEQRQQALQRRRLAETDRLLSEYRPNFHRAYRSVPSYNYRNLSTYPLSRPRRLY